MLLCVLPMFCELHHIIVHGMVVIALCISLHPAAGDNSNHHTLQQATDNLLQEFIPREFTELVLVLIHHQRATWLDTTPSHSPQGLWFSSAL